MVGILVRARNETMGGVAQAIGMHRNRLADKIAGRRQFTEAEILALANHFGVEPGRLFDDPLELLGVSAPSRCTGVPSGQRTWPALLRAA